MKNVKCLSHAALAELDARGVALMRPRSVGLDNNEQVWISDPDGNRIEFMQMAPDSLHQRARERLAKARNGGLGLDGVAGRRPATMAGAGGSITELNRNRDFGPCVRGQGGFVVG